MRKIVNYARDGAPGFIGGLLGVVLTATAAEYIRLEIQKTGYPTPVERVLGMERSEFQQYPIEWKQLFAQVAMEPESYTGQTIAILSGISPEQASTIERVAAHVLGGDFIIRDNDTVTRHPIDGMTLHDILDLEASGILQTVATGLELTGESENAVSFRQAIRPKSHVLSIEDPDPSKKLKLAITTLTGPGKEIVGLLRKPSDIEHLAWVADHIRVKGFQTTLWASWTDAEEPNMEWQARRPIVLD